VELAAFKKYISDFFTVNKNKIFLFLKIFVAAGLLFFIITTVKISEIVDAFENANYLLISAAFVLLIPNVFLQYWKWLLTCDTILNYKERKVILISLFQGFAAGAFTPFRLGEYFGRAFLFKEKTLLKVTLATLIDKFFPLSIVAFSGALASILFVHFYYDVTIYITIALFVVVFTLFYLLILLLIDPEFWNNFLFNKIRKSRYYKFFSKMNFIKNLDRNYTLKMFSVSVLFYLCFTTQFVILISAFSNQFNFMNFYWAAYLVMFTKTFFPAVSLSEIGIREGASVFFLGQMGVNAASAFDAAIFLFFINILIPSLIGLALLFKKNND
jgi:uncharacterized membrane protein YbhN (UPF0104 family)